MILLYADPVEVKYVDYEYKFCVGICAKKIKDYHKGNFLKITLRNADKAILFGTCGRLDSNLRDYGELIIPGMWSDGKDWIYVNSNGSYGITSDRSIKHKWERQALFLQGFYCVDQESFHVGKLCKELGVEFISVRYMIDRCDRKAVPTGINHFWRMYQHKRMQLKFNEWLKENV